MKLQSSLISLVVVSILLASASTPPVQALEQCKAKINAKDGTILVSGKGLTGSLLWGTTAGAENNSVDRKSTRLNSSH